MSSKKAKKAPGLANSDVHSGWGLVITATVFVAVVVGIVAAYVWGRPALQSNLGAVPFLPSVDLPSLTVSSVPGYSNIGELAGGLGLNLPTSQADIQDVLAQYAATVCPTNCAQSFNCTGHICPLGTFNHPIGCLSGFILNPNGTECFNTSMCYSAPFCFADTTGSAHAQTNGDWAQALYTHSTVTALADLWYAYTGAPPGSLIPRTGNYDGVTIRAYLSTISYNSAYPPPSKWTDTWINCPGGGSSSDDSSPCVPIGGNHNTLTPFEMPLVNAYDHIRSSAQNAAFPTSAELDQQAADIIDLVNLWLSIPGAYYVPTGTDIAVQSPTLTSLGLSFDASVQKLLVDTGNWDNSLRQYQATWAPGQAYVRMLKQRSCLQTWQPVVVPNPYRDYLDCVAPDPQQVLFYQSCQFTHAGTTGVPMPCANSAYFPTEAPLQYGTDYVVFNNWLPATCGSVSFESLGYPIQPTFNPVWLGGGQNWGNLCPTTTNYVNPPLATMSEIMAYRYSTNGSWPGFLF